MPRKIRKNQLGNFFHVMSQGINKEFIFQNDFYKEKYRKILIEKLQNSNISIISYCIMSNHVHLLINSEDISNISKFMQKVNTSYSYFYNKNKNRVGYVFRDRFLCQEIANGGHLFQCIKYIHYNPIKAEITNKLSDYKYSSYNEFIENKIIINDNLIKNFFNSISEYEKHFYDIHRNYNNEKFDFLEVKDKDINEYIEEAQKRYEINIKEAISNKNLLKKIVQEAREKTNVNIRELADILGVSKSTISNYSKY